MTEAERIEAVQRAQQGDEDALQQLLVEYHGICRASVVRSMPPALRFRLDPDDILQRTYISAFQSLPGCRFAGPAAFFGWLETIALSRLHDEERALRRAKRDFAREVALDAGTTCYGLAGQLLGTDLTPSRQMSRQEAVAAAMTCLARLSVDQRLVLQRRFLDGRDVAQVASEMGRSDAAVHMLCHRALKRLRELLTSAVRSLTAGSGHEHPDANFPG